MNYKTLPYIEAKRNKCDRLLKDSEKQALELSHNLEVCVREMLPPLEAVQDLPRPGVPVQQPALVQHQPGVSGDHQQLQQLYNGRQLLLVQAVGVVKRKLHSDVQQQDAQRPQHQPDIQQRPHRPQQLKQPPQDD